MTKEEFESTIPLGSVCFVSTTIQSNHTFEINGVIYEKSLNDKFCFRFQNGNLTFEIPISSVEYVYCYPNGDRSVYFLDH